MIELEKPDPFLYKGRKLSSLPGSDLWSAVLCRRPRRVVVLTNETRWIAFVRVQDAISLRVTGGKGIKTREEGQKVLDKLAELDLGTRPI